MTVRRRNGGERSEARKKILEMCVTQLNKRYFRVAVHHGNYVDNIVQSRSFGLRVSFGAFRVCVSRRSLKQLYGNQTNKHNNNNKNKRESKKNATFKVMTRKFFLLNRLVGRSDNIYVVHDMQRTPNKITRFLSLGMCYIFRFSFTGASYSSRMRSGRKIFAQQQQPQPCYGRSVYV